MKTKSPGVSPETAETVLARDNWSCVCCGKPITGDRGVHYSIHHRIPRGMGGSRDPRLNMTANLLTLCGSGTTGCHGVVERYRSWARERGLLLWRSQEPDRIAVAAYRKGNDPLFCEFDLVLLDNEGGRKSVDDV
jgi:hypothetical protein